MLLKPKKPVSSSKLVVWITLIGFIVLVLLPTFYLISYVFLEWDEVRFEVFENPIIGDENWKQMLKVLFFSFRLSFSTVIFDLIFGIPLAYILARKNFPGKSLLEDIVTLPLVMPTSGFGFATLITWTTVAGLGGVLGLNSGLIPLDAFIPLVNVPFIVFIVHVTLTFPYIVRTLATKFRSIDITYEVASRTLGANPLTTFRKILFPLSIPGIFSGSVLAFARSLGETGATIIVAGVSSTASIAIVRWTSEFKLATASFMGSLLVIIAWIIILPVELYLGQGKRSLNVPFVVPISLTNRILKFENYVSKKLSRLKDLVPLFIVAVTVIVPILAILNSVILYWSADPYTGKIEGGVWNQLFGPSQYFNILLRATLTSIIVALVSTFIALCISIPLVFIIERKWYGPPIRSILKIPLIIPTSSLGLSVLLLWVSQGFNLIGSGIWLIILTHIVFAVPVIVESMIAAYEGSDISMYEDSARTLGATAYNAIETVSLPLIKGGIITGFILAFTRSLGETGATFIVMGRDITVPALVVNMVEALAIPAALFTSTYLIILSMFLLVIIRITTRGP
ncbi:MAG: iron ABC transporter permease [Candidatus Bathyarchaeota archaeon]|nr:MAG: iron ABC transporter permease [Candidatus Bathyarchaeota archaeon]